MSQINSPTCKQLYSELLSLTQLYVLRTQKLTSRTTLSRENCLTLKPFVPKNQKVGYQTSLSLKEIPIETPISPTFIEAKPLLSTESSTNIGVAPEVNSTFPKAESFSVSPPHIPADKIQTEPKINKHVLTDKKNFLLEPLAPTAFEISCFRKFFQEHFPHHTLTTEIPNDQLALKISKAWANKHHVLPVVILSFNEQNQSLNFLKNIVNAISLCLKPACIVSGIQIEKNQQWEQLLSTPDLRLIIACDYELYLQKNLIKHYKQSPEKNLHYLNDVPLLLLSDLNLYLKRPELKSFLWNAICNILK